MFLLRQALIRPYVLREVTETIFYIGFAPILDSTFGINRFAFACWFRYVLIVLVSDFVVLHVRETFSPVWLMFEVLFSR
jgi:predicted ABC-type exoprotein transport system permease subunit